MKYQSAYAHALEVQRQAEAGLKADREDEARRNACPTCAALRERVRELDAEVVRLRVAAAYAYQLAGMVGAGIIALDNLSSVSTGNPPPHEWPVAESGEIARLWRLVRLYMNQEVDLIARLVQGDAKIARLAADAAKKADGERDELQRKLADSESIRRAEKETLIAETAAHAEAKRQLEEARKDTERLDHAMSHLFIQDQVYGTGCHRIYDTRAEIDQHIVAMRKERKDS